MGSAQGLTYIDRYGMCDPNTVEKGTTPNELANLNPDLQEACKNKKCGYAEGKTLKQTIDISTLSKEASFNTSIDIVMENNSEIKQKQVRVIVLEIIDLLVVRNIMEYYYDIS